MILSLYQQTPEVTQVTAEQSTIAQKYLHPSYSNIPAKIYGIPKIHRNNGSINFFFRNNHSKRSK